MKKLSIIIFILFVGQIGFSQTDAISKYFEQYMDDEDFTVVYISGKMFSMFADVDEDDADAKEAMKGLRGLRILTTDKKNGMALYQEAVKKFDVSEYEELMKIRDGKENVDFYIREEGKILKELLLLVGGEDDFVLISFIGELDLKSISNLSNSMDIDSLEYLEEIEEEKNN